MSTTTATDVAQDYLTDAQHRLANTYRRLADAAYSAAATLTDDTAMPDEQRAATRLVDARLESLRHALEISAAVRTAARGVR